MPDFRNLSQFPLKVIFAIHLVLVTLVLQGYWYPNSIIFYNTLFFICLLWAIHHIESDEPLQFAVLINVLSIVFDVITLSCYFPGATTPGKFSAGMMIINMIFRVITSIYLLRIGQARGGSLATVLPPNPAMGFGRQDYEDISHPISTDFVGI